MNVFIRLLKVFRITFLIAILQLSVDEQKKDDV